MNSGTSKRPAKASIIFKRLEIFMAVPILSAISLDRELQSGRTKPCIFTCEDNPNGTFAEYVVKLKAGMDSREIGLSYELIASQLAILLDIPTPEPALIEIDPMLSEIISEPGLSAKIRGSSGLNFGSKLIIPGFETWPIGKSIPSNLKILSAEIFAFDALIQNPDRRVEKPNVLWKSDDLYIIDHELGFSFTLDVLPSKQPWKISNLNFLSKHLFYLQLKGQTLNLDRFSGALDLLTDGAIQSILSSIPGEWQNHHLPKIKNHFDEISQHRNDFIDEIRRVLL